MISYEDIEKVRKDIKDYERHKRNKRIGAATAALSTIGATIAAGKGSKMVYPALGAAFLSGIGTAKSRKDEQASLGRIKRFYDLRRMSQEKVAIWTTPVDFASSLIGVAPAIGASVGMLASGLSKGKISPMKGILGGAAAATAMAFGADLGGIGPGGSIMEAATDLAGGNKIIGTGIGLGADLAFIPHAAKGVSSSTSELLHIAAKAEAGKALTDSEKATRAAWSYISTKADQVKKMKEGPLKKLLNYGMVYFEPWMNGEIWGSRIGKGIKEVEKFSPEYAELLLKATKGGPEAEAALKARFNTDKRYFMSAGKILERTGKKLGLKETISGTGEASEQFIKDIAKNPGKVVHYAQRIERIADKGLEAAKVLESTVDRIPMGKYLLNKSMAGSQSSAGEIGKAVFDDPRKLVDIAKKIDRAVASGVRAGKAGLGAAGLAALGYSIGGYKKRHPLAEDSLPKEIIEDRREERRSPLPRKVS
jgi:hypothetical protein